MPVLRHLLIMTLAASAKNITNKPCKPGPMPALLPVLQVDIELTFMHACVASSAAHDVVDGSAKNITNKPRINEDPKDAMLREFQEEIQRLKAALMVGGTAYFMRQTPEVGCSRYPMFVHAYIPDKRSSASRRRSWCVGGDVLGLGPDVHVASYVGTMCSFQQEIQRL
jgi:hypothetical protein